MAESETTPVQGMYGGWKQPTMAGLGGLSMRITMMLFVAAILLIVIMGTMGVMTALKLALPLAGVVAIVTIKNLDGVSIGGRISERVMWQSRVAGGGHIFKGGPAGKTGQFRLPGLTGKLNVTDAQDLRGRTYGLISCPAQHTVTAVVGCEPGGLGLIDQDEVENQVAGYAAWLTALGLQPELVAAQVCIETAPDPGQRLSHVIESRIDPDAPEFARRVLAESVTASQGRSTQVLTRVSLTWSVPKLTRRGSDMKAVAEAVATRLDALMGLLGISGAGALWPMNSSELAEMVRVAYDPASATWFDQVRAEGHTPPVTWADAGPSVTVAEWAGFRHESAWSRTWAMTKAPQGLVNSGVLINLLGPHRDVTRKRVTLLYRPIEPGKAAALVDQDMKAALAAQRSVKGPEVRHSIAFQQAQQTAAEQASGAGLVEFGCLVTATTDELDAKEQVCAAVESIGASARLRLRPMYGMQDAAFAACLPLGLMLEGFSVMPKGL